MPDLGTKFECSNCGTKFYDLGKPEPICPKCGTLYVAGEDTSAAASKAARKRRKADVVARPTGDDVVADEAEFTPDDDATVEPEIDDEDIEDFGADEESEEDIDDDEP